MTEKNSIAHETTVAVVKRVARKTSALIAITAVVSLILNRPAGFDPRWWFVPVSVVFGGALGMVNFRWLSISVEKVYLKKDTGPTAAKVAAIFIHFLKLSAIFVILFIVIKWKMVNVFGLVAGLSLCFLAILWEGFAIMRRNQSADKI